MGSSCSVSADEWEEKRARRGHVNNNNSQLEREKYEARVNPLQDAGNAEEIPRDVLLTRMWNSVVCGEFVKNQSVLFVSPTDPVLTVVQQMVARSADYCCVREPADGSAALMADSNNANTLTSPLSNAVSAMNSMSAKSPVPAPLTTIELEQKMSTDKIESAIVSDTATDNIIIANNTTINNANTTSTPASLAPPAVSRPLPVGKVKWNYLALFDWRDLNSLLVLACKRNQLHQLEANKEKEKENEEKKTATNDESGNDSSAAPSPQPAPAQPAGSSLPPSLSLALPKSTGVTHTIIQDFQLERLEPFLHFLDLKRTPILFAANLCTRNPLVHVHVATPLLGGAILMVGTAGAAEPADKKKIKKNATAPFLSNTKPELYRLMVLNKDKEFIGALSQLDCMKFVASKLSSLGAMGDEQLHDLGLGQRRVQTISWKSPVVNAISLMHEKSLSSIAIIDDEGGKLVGSISTTDVRHLFQTAELLLTLQRPVSVFVSSIRHTANPPPVARSPTHFLTPRATLNEAIKEILAKRIRRVWIVNDNHQPIGVLSISDIVKFLLPQPKVKSNQAAIHLKNKQTKTFLAP